MGEVYDEFIRELDAYRTKYEGRPDEELTALALLALEREELVVVGYDDALMRARLAATPLPEPVRDLMRHALAWAWKDEEMHAIFIRGALLRGAGPLRRAITFVQQWTGAVGGWVSSVRQNVSWRDAPLSRALATAVAWIGIATGKVSRAVRKQLELHAFREFCAFNVEAEKTAALGWRRMADLAESARVGPARAARDFRKMQADEERHAAVFEAFLDALDDGDALAAGVTVESLAARIGAIGEVFLPRSLREVGAAHPLGAGGRVVALQAERGKDKRAALRDVIERAGLEAELDRAGKPRAEITVAIKPTFMLGYDRRDRSNVTDPDLVAELARWLRERGAGDVVVVEAPNLYDQFYQRRSVHEVARYFGFDDAAYRLVDVGDEQAPHSFVRGMAQHSVSRTWADADVRISFAKMRSHPVEMAYLTVANLEGLGGRCEDYLFAERQAHRDAALMMVLDAFPPGFAIVEGFDVAADGLVGVLGCPDPPRPRRLYAGADATAVDVVVARHLGVVTPTRFPLLRAATYWFGDPSDRIALEGVDTPVAGWRGPYATEISTLLSFLASPVYELGSGRGALFVAQMDEAAFPPLEAEGVLLRAAREAIQTLLGLRLD